jgi:hypothetical protein
VSEKSAKLALSEVALLLSLICLNFGAAAGVSPEWTATTNIRDIGIPVRSVNWVRLHAGRTAQNVPCLHATMGQTADNLFVLQIDPETGRCRQFVAEVPGLNLPTATLLSHSGKLYIGAAYFGHLFCFDPARNVLEDLGAIHPGKATFPCRLDEMRRGEYESAAWNSRLDVL